MKEMHTFRCHLPNLLREMIEGHPNPGPLTTSVNLTMPLLAKLTERAIELDDPELNICMLNLSLYDVPPDQILKKIDEQKARG